MAARSLSFLPIPTAPPHSAAPDKPISSLSPPPNHHAVRLRRSLRATPISISPSPPFPRPSLRSDAAVAFVLPTAKPEIAVAGKMPRWSSKAVKSFSMAELEAWKFGYSNTGTEALLMGILLEGTNEAAKFLRANGITLFKVREETEKLLGKSSKFFVGPLNPPLTESAQRALDWAVDEKLKSAGEDGEITTAHMLLGIWSEKESAGHKILASLGFDDQKASEVAKFANQDS